MWVVWEKLTLQVLVGHSGAEEAVAAGPGGLLASGGGDGVVKVWREGRDGL
jgi:hypothetical protein